MKSPFRIVIVPGWRNSGPGHWQSLWAEQLPDAVRVEQQDWLVPHRDAWVTELEKVLLADERPAVIVAHSLGCITTVHLGEAAAARVHGALLVAPADPERRAQLEDFAPCPMHPCLIAACWWPAAMTRFAPYAALVPMHGPGAVSWCGCRTPGISMSNLAMAHGRWGWHCCSR